MASEERREKRSADDIAASAEVDEAPRKSVRQGLVELLHTSCEQLFGTAVLGTEGRATALREADAARRGGAAHAVRGWLSLSRLADWLTLSDYLLWRHNDELVSIVVGAPRGTVRCVMDAFRFSWSCLE